MSFSSFLFCSRQRAPIHERRREVGRLRGGRAADQHDQQAEHVRGHALLDGARGHQAERLRRQSRHLVARDHGHRAGQGRAPQLRHAPHEGALPHTQEQPAPTHGQLQQTVQGVHRSMLEQRSGKCKTKFRDFQA